MSDTNKKLEIKMSRFIVVEQYLIRGGWEFEPVVKIVEIDYEKQGKAYGWNITHRNTNYYPSIFQFETLKEAKEDLERYLTFFKYGDQSSIINEPYGKCIEFQIKE